MQKATKMYILCPYQYNTQLCHFSHTQKTKRLRPSGVRNTPRDGAYFMSASSSSSIDTNADPNMGKTWKLSDNIPYNPRALSVTLAQKTMWRCCGDMLGPILFKVSFILLYGTLFSFVVFAIDDPLRITLVCSLSTILYMMYITKEQPAASHTITMLPGILCVYVVYSGMMASIQVGYQGTVTLQWLRDLCLAAIACVFALRFALMSYPQRHGLAWPQVSHRVLTNPIHFFLAFGVAGSGVYEGFRESKEDPNVTYMNEKSKKSIDNDAQGCEFGSAVAATVVLEVLYWTYGVICVLPYFSNSILISDVWVSVIRLMLFIILYILTDLALIPRQASGRVLGPTLFTSTTYILFLAPAMLWLCALHFLVLLFYFLLILLNEEPNILPIFNKMVSHVNNVDANVISDNTLSTVTIGDHGPDYAFVQQTPARESSLLSSSSSSSLNVTLDPRVGALLE